MKTLKDYLESLSPERLSEIENDLREMKRKLPLNALREACGVTQKKLASKLGISQGAVSRMESRSDALLSSIFSYVKCLGGKASVRIDVPNDNFTICGSQGDDPFDQNAWIFELQRTHRAHSYSTGPHLWKNAGTVHGSRDNIAANDSGPIIVRRQNSQITVLSSISAAARTA